MKQVIAGLGASAALLILAGSSALGSHTGFLPSWTAGSSSTIDPEHSSSSTPTAPGSFGSLSPARPTRSSGTRGHGTVPDWQPLESKDPCTIRGTIHGDVLDGTRGGEVICGLGGNDFVNRAGGNDRIDGGAGADHIDGGAGRDTLAGGNGNDCFATRDGARDLVDGGPGHDAAVVDRVDKLVKIEKTYARWPKKSACR